MLDQMRKHSRSFIIYIFFGIIIAVFVINFGPQSHGCVAETSYAGQINGDPLAVSDVSYALSIVGFNGQGMNEEQVQRLRAFAVDRLVVRELMANKARELGLVVSEQQVRDMLLAGRYLALGIPRRLTADDEPLDYDRFSKFVRFNWHITVRGFKDQQRRELLAEQLREMQRLATKASPEEVKQDFVYQNTTTTLSYVRLDPDMKDATLEPTPEQLKQFSAENTQRIAKYYEANKASYTNRPEEIALHVIAVAIDPAGGKEAALRKAGVLRTNILQGGDFAQVAAEESSDDTSKARGGEVGWISLSTHPYGAAATPVLQKLGVGELSAPVEAQDRVWLFKLTGRRSGDLRLDQVREEIARVLLKEQLAETRTKARAEQYVAQLRAGKKLEELFASAEANKDSTTTGGEAVKPSAESAGEGAAQAARDGRPKLQTTASFRRSAEHLVPGIGISKELSKLAFELGAGQIVDHPIKVGEAYYVVAVKERERPDMAEWNKRQGELVEEFTQRRWAELEQQFETELCEQAVKAKHVRIDLNTLSPREPGSQQPQAPAYLPCQTLRML